MMSDSNQNSSCGMLGHGFELHQCLSDKYVGCKGPAAMLGTIELAGVTPEVNLRNPSLALKTRADVNRRLNHRYQ